MDWLSNLWNFLDWLHFGLIILVILLGWFSWDQSEELSKCSSEGVEDHNKWETFYREKYEKFLKENQEIISVVLVGDVHISDNNYACEKVEKRMIEKGCDMTRVIVLPYYTEFEGKDRLRMKMPKVVTTALKEKEHE